MGPERRDVGSIPGRGPGHSPAMAGREGGGDVRGGETGQEGGQRPQGRQWVGGRVYSQGKESVLYPRAVGSPATV